MFLMKQMSYLVVHKWKDKIISLNIMCLISSFLTEV